MPTQDDEYRKQMDEISGMLAVKLVDGGLVNRKGFGKNKIAERETNIKDTKRAIWDVFYEHFQAQASNVN